MGSGVGSILGEGEGVGSGVGWIDCTEDGRGVEEGSGSGEGPWHAMSRPNMPDKQSKAAPRLIITDLLIVLQQVRDPADHRGGLGPGGGRQRHQFVVVAALKQTGGGGAGSGFQSPEGNVTIIGETKAIFIR